MSTAMGATGPAAAAIRGGDEILLAFTRALRAGGVPVTLDRAHDFLTAAALLGAEGPDSVRAAGRSTLCAGPDDLVRFDQVFEAFFDSRQGLPRRRPAAASDPAPTQLPDVEPTGQGGAEADEVVRAAASPAEVLRHRDVASLSAPEKQRLLAMMATLHPRPPLRRTGRHRRWHRGEVDAPRTLRESLRRMGEPGEIAWRRRVLKPRRVVLLVDVSGSMTAYADVLLRLAHRLSHGMARGSGRVETFTIGTRVTHVTRALRIQDPERALVAAGDTVPDWSGGTRLGETMRFFLDRWGQRGMARGAVVVVFSDGWERGDASMLAEQMARLRRIAHRVVWVNPHRGKDGYEAVQTGVRAVLPFCDEFVAGHSLATYADLVRVLADA